MPRPPYGEPYDPEIRKTPHGSRIYTAWKRVRRHPYYDKWKSFPVFYEWSMENGYVEDAQLVVIGDECRYFPDSCCWTAPVETEPRELDWIKKWNKTVNRIRKYYGMPPLEDTNYEHE